MIGRELFPLTGRELHADQEAEGAVCYLTPATMTALDNWLRAAAVAIAGRWKDPGMVGPLRQGPGGRQGGGKGVLWRRREVNPFPQAPARRGLGFARRRTKHVHHDPHLSPL